jgi:hypothetical protein
MKVNINSFKQLKKSNRSKSHKKKLKFINGPKNRKFTNIKPVSPRKFISRMDKRGVRTTFASRAITPRKSPNHSNNISQHLENAPFMLGDQFNLKQSNYKG